MVRVNGHKAYKVGKRRLLATAGLIMALSLAGGCALVGGGKKPLDTFDLSAARPDTSGPRTQRRQILVNEPAAIKVLDGENIVIKPAPGVITFLGGAQWGDRLPKVIQARLIESFERSGRIRGVGRPGEGLAIDYQLVSDVRAFEVALDGGARAHVALSVRLLNDRSGQVARQRVFEATAPLSGSGNEAYVAAMNAAFAEVAGEIVDWVLAAI